MLQKNKPYSSSPYAYYIINLHNVQYKVYKINDIRVRIYMQNMCFMMIIIQMNCFFCMGWIEIDNDNEKRNAVLRSFFLD